MQYLAAAVVVELNIEEIVRRVRAVAVNEVEAPKPVAAVLGGASPPKLSVFGMLDEFAGLTALPAAGRFRRMRIDKSHVQ